jgi:hypothetical protein
VDEHVHDPGLQPDRPVAGAEEAFVPPDLPLSKAERIREGWFLGLDHAGSGLGKRLPLPSHSKTLLEMFLQIPLISAAHRPALDEIHVRLDESDEPLNVFDERLVDLGESPSTLTRGSTASTRSPTSSSRDSMTSMRGSSTPREAQRGR